MSRESSAQSLIFILSARKLKLLFSQLKYVVKFSLADVIWFSFLRPYFYPLPLGGIERKAEEGRSLGAVIHFPS